MTGGAALTPPPVNPPLWGVPLFPSSASLSATLHFAFALNRFCVIVLLQWAASYDGLVPFWQPSSMCCCSQFSQLYCCIVEHKPSLSSLSYLLCHVAAPKSSREIRRSAVSCPNVIWAGAWPKLDLMPICSHIWRDAVRTVCVTFATNRWSNVTQMLRIVRGTLPAHKKWGHASGLSQATYTCVPLSPSCTTWYRSIGGDPLRLGRWP